MLCLRAIYAHTYLCTIVATRQPLKMERSETKTSPVKKIFRERVTSHAHCICFVVEKKEVYDSIFSLKI